MKRLAEWLTVRPARGFLGALLLALLALVALPALAWAPAAIVVLALLATGPAAAAMAALGAALPIVWGFSPAIRTYQRKRDAGTASNSTPLAHFLLADRAGHCEYFASAAALILRHAGIPTRYAIGYAVPEAAPGEAVAVRGKDGHAWTLVYHDGAWHDFDATPAGWQAFEQYDRSLAQRASDAMSWLRYQFLSWRYYTEPGTIMRFLFWALIPVLLWKLWRIFRNQKRVDTDACSRESSVPHPAGLDSDFRLPSKNARLIRCAPLSLNPGSMCSWNSSCFRISGRSCGDREPPAQVAIVAPHQVQQERTFAADRARERRQRFTLGFAASNVGLAALELLQALLDRGELNARVEIPYHHKNTFEIARVEEGAEMRAKFTRNRHQGDIAALRPHEDIHRRRARDLHGADARGLP